MQGSSIEDKDRASQVLGQRGLRPIAWTRSGRSTTDAREKSARGVDDGRVFGRYKTGILRLKHVECLFVDVLSRHHVVRRYHVFEVRVECTHNVHAHVTA